MLIRSHEWADSAERGLCAVGKPYFFPSIEAGRFINENGKIMMPLSITCHHAATEGYHVSRFLDALQTEADAFEKYLGL